MLKFDLEKATGACVAPLSTSERFYWKVFAIPFSLVFCIGLSVPIWQWLRQRKRLAVIFEKTQAPLQLSMVHVKRGLLNIYLFSFAPLTQAAIEMIVCVRTSAEETKETPYVLVVDYGISCQSDEFHRVAMFSAASIVVLIVLIPAYLIRKSKKSRAGRDVSLQLEVLQIDTIFHEADTDHSGVLEKDEIGGLLEMLGAATGPRAVSRTMREFKRLPQTLFASMDEDHSGSLDYDEVKELCVEMGRHLTEQQLADACEEMDADGSGDIDLKEFQQWWAKINRAREHDPDTQIHVRGIGVEGWDGTEDGVGREESAAALARIFGEYGEFISAAVRHRVDMAAGANTSWALVRMTDSESVDRVLAAPPVVTTKHRDVVVSSTELNCSRFSKTAADQSTGEMSQRGRIHGGDIGAPSPQGDNEEVEGVTLPEFHVWFRQRIRAMVETPFDILYGTSKSSYYWWFSQLLWLKFAVNALFAFGYTSDNFAIEWHVWMHLLLAASVCVSVILQPYANKIDQQVELFALLTLACTTHIASVFKAGETWEPSYIVMISMLAGLPLIILAVLKLNEVLNTKRGMKQRRSQWGNITGSVADAAEKVKDAVEDAFSYIRTRSRTITGGVFGGSAPRQSSALLPGPTPRFKLQCTVLECAELAKADVFSQNDVFVTATLDGQERRSSTIDEGGANPVWGSGEGESFDWKVAAAPQDVAIVVWDADVASVNDIIGECRVPLGSELDSRGWEKQDWFDLQCEAKYVGKVRLRFNWQPLPNLVGTSHAHKKKPKRAKISTAYQEALDTRVRERTQYSVPMDPSAMSSSPSVRKQTTPDRPERTMRLPPTLPSSASRSVRASTPVRPGKELLAAPEHSADATPSRPKTPVRAAGSLSSSTHSTSWRAVTPLEPLAPKVLAVRRARPTTPLRVA